MNFEDAWQVLLRREGGYSNNPKDSGGETCWGITERVARAHGYTGEMRLLPQEHAKTIGRFEYWSKYQCDRFPYSVAYQVFDAAYNGGHPIQWLQQAVGASVDGVVGPQTISLVLLANPSEVVSKFTAYRIKYLISLPRDKWLEFGRGWMGRLADSILETTK